MPFPNSGIVVITGESGAGKTTLCEHLAAECQRRGVEVAGILTPPRFIKGEKVGLDVLDLRSGVRRPLAERELDGNGPSTSHWHFHPEGLAWGARSLEQALPCSLLIVDEIGPLELERREGWANALDLLGRQSSPAVIVVRPGLLEKLAMHLEGIPLVVMQVTRTNRDSLLAQLIAFAEGTP